MRVVGCWEIMNDLIRKENVRKFAEVGVGPGGLVKYLASEGLSFDSYVGVDPYTHYSGVGAGKYADILPRKWIEMYKQVKALEQVYPWFTLIRLQSVDAAKEFEGGFFDLVFIDADHTYASACKDIQSWWPLVKEGGILSGHDYVKRFEKEVVRAVNEFVGGKLQAKYGVWCVRKICGSPVGLNFK